MRRRGAETGSGFQEMINRTNDAYERLGRACITRKSIPGKYLVRQGEVRRGLSLPDGAAVDFSTDRGPARLAVGSLARSGRTSHAGRLATAKGPATHAERYQFVPESKAEPDYGGVIAPAGRAIFYDAKTTRREVLDFDNLHPHQIEFLERVVRCGAVAGFLVEFSLHQAVYFLPIQVLLRWRAESTRKSLPYRFFSERLIQAVSGRGLLIFDYLAAIESQEERYGRDFVDLRIAG